jgi:glycosyltransferase involved in cell wall biosynthesis
MERVKVCFFSRALSPWQVGGVETYVYEISKELCKRDFDVHIICDKHYFPGEKDYIHLNGIHIHFVNYSIKIPNISYSISAGLKALELDKVYNIDIFHGNGIYGLGFALFKFLRLNNKPFITTIHNVIFRDAQSVLINIDNHKYEVLRHIFSFLGLTIYSILEGLIITRVADLIITVSKYTKIDTIKTYLIKEKKIKLIYNVIPLKKIQKIKIKNNYTNKNPIILFIGRISYRKGINTMIKSVPIVKKK